MWSNHQHLGTACTLRSFLEHVDMRVACVNMLGAFRLISFIKPACMAGFLATFDMT